MGNHADQQTAVVVNDDALQLQLLGEMLKACGLQVFPYDGAEQALAALNPLDPPALIVTDLHMPGIDGWRFCRLLRSSDYPAYNDIPILVVSATFAGEHVRQITSEAGANAFMPSPVDVPQFRAQIRMLLEGGVALTASRVLIVEDCLAVSVALRRAFELRGYEAHVAHEGTRASRLFDDHKPDIILLDYHLPDTQGDKLLKEFRRISPKSVVVLMTADPDPRLAARWMMEGASAYVRKPCSPDYLVGLCERASRERALLGVEEVLESRTLELRRSEERYRALFEMSPLGIGITTMEGVFLDCNEQMERMVGYTLEELRDLTYRHLIPTRWHSVEVVREAELAAGRLQGNGSGTLEKEMIRKDGTVFPVSVTGWLIRDADGMPSAIGRFVQDITLRKQTEMEQVRLERIRAMGELSAGVSHNLNNILTGILGPVQMLSRQTQDPDIMEEVETIGVCGARARDLVSRLHQSVRGDDGHFEPVMVNHVIEQAVQTARPKWKDEPEASGISLEVETALTETPEVRGTASGLYDIVLNLLLNAVEAIPTGGTIRIETAGDGDDVVLTVRDSGLGMDDETKKRLFEPFYTTKGDVGTGLGLSTVYNTVSRWEGSIAVESEPGKGSAFTIRLPKWLGPTSPVCAREAPQTSRPGCLLIVEDDDAVRGLLVRLLAARHTVDIVEDGRCAMDGFRAGHYDAALIDLGLPQVPGDQVAREMRTADPCLSTVLITGWRLPEDDRRAAPFDYRLQKPFDDLKAVEDTVASAILLNDERRRGRKTPAPKPSQPSPSEAAYQR